MAATLRKFNPQLTKHDALNKIRDWFFESNYQPRLSASGAMTPVDEVSRLWDDDKRILQWFRENENAYRSMVSLTCIIN
jgi:hypothetical protein